MGNSLLVNNKRYQKSFEKRIQLPRIPLDGSIDLTYRCNNSCLHCWLKLPQNSLQKKEELTLNEIQDIVSDARKMGCQAWSISGGEPMMRPDFEEIFNFITSKATYYKINTNGTLITPSIARLLKRRGNTMVALYGATSEVHDFITQNPGSYEAMMRGIAYLKEAGTGFTVQIIPLRSNFHQYNEMLELAQSLSPDYRIGAPWLWLTADQSLSRNKKIIEQRLNPTDVIMLDDPDPSERFLSTTADITKSSNLKCKSDNKHIGLFSSCTQSRQDFHIDPYGQLSFCYYIKDPTLRYDLREGTFREGWDEFIPSLSSVVKVNQEYLDNCGSCELKEYCRHCPVFSYLEHGRYSAKVEYLCNLANENKKFHEKFRRNNTRYYQVGGTTIQLTTDFPIMENTFDQKFNKFEVDGPGDDTIGIRLKSVVPKLTDLYLKKEVYRKPPWAIYKNLDAWTFIGLSSDTIITDPNFMGIFSKDFSRGTIFRHKDYYDSPNLNSLTTFPSDQIILSQVFSSREAIFIHAAGMKMQGQGLLFVGHSEAGKSTIAKLLRNHGTILCDESIIVRRWPEGFRIHGTWSHGELPDISPASAPLRAIFYLEQAKTNELIPIVDQRERLGKFLSHVVKALVTEDWWDKTLDLSGKIATEVPTYRLKFDKSGAVVDVLKQLYE